MPRDKIVRKAISIRFTKACGLVNKNPTTIVTATIVVIIAQDLAFRRMMATGSLGSSHTGPIEIQSLSYSPIEQKAPGS